MRSSISAARKPRGACLTALLLVQAAIFAAWSGPAAAQAAPGARVPPASRAPFDAPVEPGMPDVRAAAKALEQARKLFAEGKSDEALAAIDSGLKAAPDDAQLRFQRGVIEADSGRTDAAIDTFTALTQDFPELPEPHNNLATLYAARGDIDRARSALEDAIRALPSYALAHENLGDIYLRLAERAYQRAFAADAASRSARDKLALVRELAAKVSPDGDRPSGTRPARARPAAPAGTR